MMLDQKQMYLLGSCGNLHVQLKASQVGVFSCLTITLYLLCYSRIQIQGESTTLIEQQQFEQQQ